MSYCTIRVSEKKCATCAWWQGRREVLFQANRPFYVKADASPAPCLANGNRPITPAQRCPRHSPWEKL